MSGIDPALVGAAVSLLPSIVEWLQAMFRGDDQAKLRAEIKVRRKAKRHGIDRLFDARDK